jgi:hypothetical protein
MYDKHYQGQTHCFLALHCAHVDFKQFTAVQWCCQCMLSVCQLVECLITLQAHLDYKAASNSHFSKFFVPRVCCMPSVMASVYVQLLLPLKPSPQD